MCRERCFESQINWIAMEMALLCLGISMILVFSSRVDAQTGNANIVYVKADASGANNGNSWTDAFTDLQAAISAAQPGYQVWVAAGTYKPTSWPNSGTTERQKHFSLKNNVAVYGGFVGTEALLTQRDHIANKTICSGDVGTIGDDSDNSYHVFYHPQGTNLDKSSILDGFTINGGCAVGSGGGMSNSFVSPTIRNCVFSGNTAANLGGGMYNWDSSPLLVGCTFTGNSCQGYGCGGGMANDNNTDPTIVACTFAGNFAKNSGGGVFNQNSACPTFINCTFTGNSAAYGGAFGNYTASTCPTLINCTVSNNTAVYGGAMSNSSSGIYLPATIKNSILWGNVPAAQIYNNEYIYTNPLVSDCIVQGGYTGGTNIITEDPKLQPLANNGGVTQTCAIWANSSAVAIPEGTDAWNACTDTDQRGVPRPVSGVGLKRAIGAYDPNGTSAASTSAGTVFAWGMNYNGNLGDGTLIRKTKPVQVSVLDSVTGISAGWCHSIALKKDGTVWTWGANNQGVLGVGMEQTELMESPIPLQVPGLGNVVAVSAGMDHCLVIKSDGTVWGWGWNMGGRLGDGTGIDRCLPVQAKGLSGMVAISGGGVHSLGVKSDGTVWAWGDGGSGQIGNGISEECFTPVKVMGLSSVVSVAAGGGHSLALKSDGSVMGWGFNGNGEVGSGTTIVNHFTPVAVSGLTGITRIAAGPDQSLALKSDGTVWAWGYNKEGQLGDGTTISRFTPVKVQGLSGIVAIQCKDDHSLALQSDGTVWAWGRNDEGELGNGTYGYTQLQLTPVKLPVLIGISAIAAGSHYSMAIKEASSSTNRATLAMLVSPVGKGSTQPSTTISVDKGVPTEISAASAETYHFVNWSAVPAENAVIADANSAKTTVVLTGNATITANFAINTFTLTYLAGPNGTLAGLATQTVNYGASGTAVTAVPNTGYYFVKWSDGSTSNPRIDANVTANISVTATFAIKTFSLTYLAGANGTLTGQASQTVNYGASGTAVTAVPNTGYYFVKWSDDSTSNPRTDANVTANISVTATFAIKTFTLTYAAGANGTLAGQATQTVNYGASGTAVTAVPNTGYYFVKWSDGATANPRTDAKVTANISVTATFAVKTFTLTYVAGANGTLTGQASQTVNYGESGTAVTAVTNTGYYFVKWSDGATANPRTDVNVTADISVTAVFSPMYVKVITPNGGEIYKTGTVETIEWTSDGPISNVIIEYSEDLGKTWKMISENEINDGSYDWTIPSPSLSKSPSQDPIKSSGVGRAPSPAKAAVKLSSELLEALASAKQMALSAKKSSGTLKDSAKVIYQYGFEDGLGNWIQVKEIGDTSWSVVDNSQTIKVMGPAINPYLVTLPDSGTLPGAKSGTKAVWFGKADNGTFIGNYSSATQYPKNGGTSTAIQRGDLDSPLISLAGATNIKLTFWTWWEAESVDIANGQFDQMSVLISTNSGASYQSMGTINPLNDVNGASYTPYTSGGFAHPGMWVPVSFDIGKYAGQTVKFRFQFDSRDQLYNGFRGWMIDDVQVSGEVMPSAPVITQIVPPSGYPGDLASVIGNNFVSGAKVMIGGTAVTSSVVSQAEVQFVVPNLSPGSYDVQITNPDGMTCLLPGGFKVLYDDGFHWLVRVTATCCPSVTDKSDSGFKVYKPEMYNLTIKAAPEAGGTVEPAGTVSVEKGTDYAVKAVPSEYYSFVNWTVVGNAAMADVNSPDTSLSLTGETTITANFLIDSFKVTFDLAGKGSSIGGGELVQTVNYGSAAVAPTVQANPGWIFNGWDMPFDHITDDTAVTALYTIKQISLTYLAGPNGTLVGQTVQIVNYNTSGSAVTAVPDAYCIFLGWSDGSTANPRIDMNATADITVTANFAPIKKTVTVIYPNGGEIFNEGDIETILWMTEGAVFNVRLEYSRDLGETWNLISADEPNDGSYDWTVPSPKTSAPSKSAGKTPHRTPHLAKASQEATAATRQAISSARKAALAAAGMNYKSEADQKILYEYGFEEGMNGWNQNVESGDTAWIIVDNGQSICILNPTLNPELLTLGADDDGKLPLVMSGTKAAWFGNIDTGTYLGAFSAPIQQPKNGGMSQMIQKANLDSPEISLAGTKNAKLSIATCWEAESVDIADGEFDQMRVMISSDSGATYQLLGTLNPLNGAGGLPAVPYSTGGLAETPIWVPVSFDLGKYLGQDIRIRFQFDSVDENYNGFRGWLIDDVQVAAEMLPVPPSISEIIPPSGHPGDVSTIIGGHFVSGATVTLNGVVVASSVLSQCEAQFTAPDLPAGIYDVSICNPDGLSATFEDGYEIKTLFSWLVRAMDVTTPDVTDRSDNGFKVLEKKFFNVTVQTEPADGGSVDPSGQVKVDKGSSLQVYANPAEGFYFDGWTGDYTGMENPLMLDNIVSDMTITANFAVKTFNLAYLAGEGGALEGQTSQAVSYGEDGSPVAAVPDAGHSFTGWSDGSTQNPRIDADVTSDITVTACFIINTYTITASSSSNGMISPAGAVSVEYGSDMAYAIIPDSHCHVADVQVDGSPVGPVDSYMFSNVMADHAIYAYFAADTCTLSYGAEAGGSLDGQPNQVVNYGQNGSPVAAVPDAGHSFMGWSDGSMQNPRIDADVTADITVTACFIISTYTITASSSSNGMISPAGAVSVEYGSDMAYAIIPDSHCHVADVQVDGSSVVPVDSYAFSNVTADHAIYAYFAADTCTLSYGAEAGGSLDGQPNQVVNYGQNGSPVSAVPDSGYSFAGWSDGSMANPRTDCDVAADIAVTAKFSKIVYIITAAAGCNGQISPDGLVSVEYGGMVSFAFIPDENSHVVDVQVDGSSVGAVDSYAFSNVTADHAIYADFTKDKHTVTFIEGSNGTIKGEKVQVVEHGADCSEVEAVPIPGYHFDGWKGGIESFENPLTVCNVLMDMAVTANFAANNVSIASDLDTVNVEEGGSTLLKVKLSAEPATDAYVTVTRTAGDEDISVTEGVELLFNTSNWNIYQDVVLSAAEDADIVNGSATISCASPTAAAKDITVNEIDNDTLCIVTDVNSLAVSEGDSNSFQVKLNAPPPYDVVVYVQRSSGCEGIAVAIGSILTFTGEDWDTFKPVTLAAAEDAVIMDASAVISCTSAMASGKDVTVSRIDDDFILNILNDGNGTTTPSSILVVDKDDSPYAVSAIPSEGCHFEEWIVTGGNPVLADPYSTETTVAATDDAEITAYFYINQYDLSYTAGANGSITGEANQAIEYGACGSPVTALPDMGCHFKSWSDGSDQNPRIDTNVTADISVTAIFEFDIYTVVFDLGGLGVRIGGGELVQTVKYGCAAVEPEVQPNEGWIFLGWDRPFDAVTEDITVNALYAVKTYAVSFNAGPGGMISGSCIQFVNHGSDSDPVTAVPDAGNSFTGWTGDFIGTDNPLVIHNVTADMTVTANFAENPFDIALDSENVDIPEGGATYIKINLLAQPASSIVVSVTWASGDPDISVASAASLIFTPANWDMAQTVKLTAAEDQDTVNGTAVVKCSAAGLAEKEITAVEIDNDYILEVGNDGNGTTYPSGASIMTKGVPAVISAKANPGLKFLCWTVVDGSAVFEDANSSSTKVTAFADTAISANFAPAVYEADFKKVTMKINTDKENADTLYVLKGNIPTEMSNADMMFPFSLTVDGTPYCFDIDSGKMDFRNTKCRFRTYKHVSPSVSMVVDFKQGYWSLLMSKASLSDVLTPDDGIDLYLSVGNYTVGKKLYMDEESMWKFTKETDEETGESLNSFPLDGLGEEMSLYDIEKAHGKSSTKKPGQDWFGVTSGLLDVAPGFSFDAGNPPPVAIILDGLELDLGANVQWKQSGKSKNYSFDGIVSGVRLALEFNLDSKAWAMKVSDTDLSGGKIDSSDGIDVILQIQDFEAGLRLEADEFTTFKYPMK